MASTSGNRGFGGSAQVMCRNHPEAHLVEDSHAGDLICPECGTVVGDRVIDVGSEWRTFSNEKNAKDASRVGSAENPLLDGADLSTMIGFDGKMSANQEGMQMFKNRRTLSSANRTLLSAMREISQMCERINLPKIIADRANTIYKQVHETKQLRGRGNDAISSACLYIACRQEGVPRTFKELCAVSKVSKKDIGRVFKLILKILETSVQLITSGDFMARFCANLNLPVSIQKCATCIAKKAVDLNLVAGRSPISVAAASIYMASQASEEKKSQKEIGDIAGVAEATIRQSYKLMYPEIHKLFPDDFKFHTPIDQLPSQ